jgi:hypothetical protein
MMRLVILLGLVALTAACSDPDGARRVLEEQGYTDVRTGGYAFFSCSEKSDDYATSFQATSPAGHEVSGAVCKGFFKGSTIRFD